MSAVDGDDGAMLFAYDVLYGTVTSSAGPAEAFAGGDAWVLGITAYTDATVTALGNLHAFNTTAINGNANLFAGGDLEAVVNAGNDAFTASYGDSDINVTAGSDASVFSLGTMTADVTAGNDAWAIAWDDMEIAIDAGNDIPLVWTFGHLTNTPGGTIDAENHIGRIKSYRSIDATIHAGDTVAGTIDLVEAWESIHGTITADTSITMIRSGQSINATISPSNSPKSEDDHSVFGPLPEPDLPSLESTKASLRGWYRKLLLGQEGMLAIKGGLVLQKDALGANRRQTLKVSIGDIRAANGLFENIGYQIAHAIETADVAMRQALESNREANMHVQKLIEAGWAPAMAKAEAAKHAVELQLAAMTADHAAARQLTVAVATYAKVGAEVTRAAELKRLQIENMFWQFSQDHGDDPNLYSTNWWDYIWSDDPYYEANYWNWVKAPWRGPEKMDGWDYLLVGGKFVGWGMAIVGSVGAGVAYGAGIGAMTMTEVGALLNPLLAANRALFVNMLRPHTMSRLAMLFGGALGFYQGRKADDPIGIFAGVGTTGMFFEGGAIVQMLRVTRVLNRGLPYALGRTFFFVSMHFTLGYTAGYLLGYLSNL